MCFLSTVLRLLMYEIVRRIIVRFRTYVKKNFAVTDFADASHSKSAKSTITTVLYGIFSLENSYSCTATLYTDFTFFYRSVIVRFFFRLYDIEVKMREKRKSSHELGRLRHQQALPRLRPRQLLFQNHSHNQLENLKAPADQELKTTP